jgi:hypothetical protein
MLEPGPAKKVTVHLNEDTISNNDYLSSAVLALLIKRDVAGATVLRPAAGFGSHHRLHTAGSGIDEDQSMPVRIEFIESKAKVEAILPLLESLVVDGLIEVHDTTIVKFAAAEKPIKPAGEP